jgi:hypothetical protein
MNQGNVFAAGLLVLGFSAHEASALTIPIPYFDDFNTITAFGQNTPPAGWITVFGTVDSIHNGDFGIHCVGNLGGCVDLDGSTNQAGPLITSGTFNLAAGHTYQLSAQISGNQRGAVANNLIFGFATTSNIPLAAQTILGITSTSPFTLYSVLFTPTAAVTADVFFYDILGTNNIGPILDNVSVTAVPLPAAAWLMLSGLAALGAVARRRVSAASRASNLPAPGAKFAGDGPGLAPRARLH